MAEAHAAVAFSFSVTPDGELDVNFNRDVLRAVWESGIRSWRRRFERFKNRVHNGAYPASPMSWLFGVTFILALTLAQYDVSFGLVRKIEHNLPMVMDISAPYDLYLSCIISATILWMAMIYLMKWFIMKLLQYHGWMYDPRGKMTIKTKIWLGMMKFVGHRKAQLYSWQGSLPKLPVPSLEGTMTRYLKSVRPLLNDSEYERMSLLVEAFKSGIGKKLQFYLYLKHWWSPNYVADWWEEYVYLRGRSPIMVNSNFYGLDAILVQPSSVQVARAANVSHAFLTFMNLIDREQLQPIYVNKTVPLCSAQYERMFQTTRIPGIETDMLVHVQESNHFTVYHQGRYFKVYFKHKGRLLKPCEIEVMLQQIVDNKSEPSTGEEHLAALTAGDRTPWAKARKQFFSKGVNRTSLDAIEKGAFVLALDEDEQTYDPEDHTKLDNYCRAMLHGKGYDRWFDKSFTLVVCKNGRIGFNGEHSWADAPILGHLWEYCMGADVVDGGYDDSGHTLGKVVTKPPHPIRLQWEMNEECVEVIETSLAQATKLLNDVDLHLLVHDEFGKGFMKKSRTSPDAFIQLALQLAYFRDAGKFCLTYEASMTRFFREGRTETVRSCTNESSAFAKAMEDTTKTNKERIALMKEAANSHQDGYRDAMSGKGIDRHLFCLYVVSKYLGIETPFLKEVLSEPWRLSTSQTPHQQTDKLDLVKHPNYISAGGGFGPVADDGYGVSYIIAGEDCIFFHISCKNSCSTTNSLRFGKVIKKSLADIKALFEEN
ncbi:carnitine O-palmitoyltransferase 1, liver isoform-like isoform X2 [Lineus longissimus]|uniref:carnitine O-palmitoyltransferase 1, liver isoform-like isoform X2 n=1 Tax=Lineus longissimus TaxID=88925 RepID=UPI002B4E0B08